MKISNHSEVPVYTISGSSTARPLPEWLARKRKRSLKQDPEYANRIELLQDFEFEEASQCVRVSEDGNWVMSTGTYKPQMHVHYLPHLSLSFARHTNSLNQTFVLLSSDYSKSLHLQADRCLEFHTPGGLHYSTRIPRYGRDLKYNRRSTEALVPSVGVNSDGNGEVFRLNLELGRFMQGYEIDVGGDDYTTLGGGALQGGIHTGSVNTAAIAEESHNLLAFGTSLGTVEFWDARSRSRVGLLHSPPDPLISTLSNSRPEITALEFHRSGLTLATGSSTGLIHLYDLRRPTPLLKKDQGYGYPIQNLLFLTPTTTSATPSSTPKILSSDKRIIKIWDERDGTPWTSVEPAVDLHHVAWVPDTGMLLTANEGRQQHAFFIPQLGPAPRWCAFLDNLVEEMAEDPDDPSAFTGGSGAGGTGRKGGEVYDNYKFLTLPELRELNLDHLLGTTSLLRPYMHGWFVAQRLYEEARLISNPDLWQEQRAKSIKEKIEKERESRIRGNKAVKVKVNRRLAERMAEREEKNERRRARRVLKKGGDDEVVDGAERPVQMDVDVDVDGDAPADDAPEPVGRGGGILNDPRFARLFQDENFEVDETSREFQAINPSTKPSTPAARKLPKGLTAVEEEELADRHASSSDDDESTDEEAEEQSRVAAQQHRRPAEQDTGRISSSSYKKAGHRSQRPQMVVSSSSTRKPQQRGDRSFGARAAGLRERRGAGDAGGRARGGVVRERQVTFAPVKKGKVRREESEGGWREEKKDRRSASGNTFRRM